MAVDLGNPIVRPAVSSCPPGTERSRVVIAGASRGLGRALALRYLELRCEVWAGCRTPESATDLSARGANVYRLDVGSEGAVNEFAAAVAAAGPVDLLINAAGIDARSLGAAPDARGPFELSVEHFLSEVRVNAAGPMLMTRALLAPLLAAPAAKVVNLSSRTGSMSVGAELCWDIGYNASKAALHAITVRTARLLADRGVIVVAIHPGWVRTDMGGADAELEPEQAANQVVDTIAALSRAQSGQLLRADGSTHPW
jgi:NAD(P)-dependent dehydrogenase (short-subunit alcohol dehydrogenase family)